MRGYGKLMTTERHRPPGGTLWTAGSLLLLALALGPPAGAADQDSHAAPYPNMAPVEQYLPASIDAEIALARSAAPAAISDQATVLALTRQGYVTEVTGNNGFTCVVERSWMSPFDHPDFWNPKVRGPVCYNPAATRSVLPYTLFRTKLALAGVAKAQIKEDVRAAVGRKELSAPEPGSMSFMLAKQGYLADDVGHWHPHLMFHVPKTEASTWGANLPQSPVVLDTQHPDVPEPQTIFMVPLGRWSDGTAASHGS